MTPSVDIFSTDFFAEDPFGEPDYDDLGYASFQILPLDLHTLEEEYISHSNTCTSDTASVESSTSDNGEHGDEAPISKDNVDEGAVPKPLKQGDGDDSGGTRGSTRADDCITRTDSTCKSTSYESTDNELTDNHAHSTRSSSTQPSDPTHHDALHDCTNPNCTTQRLTIRQQEEQICFLRRKLQEYADLCEQHNIGQDLLAKHDTAIPLYSADGSGKTNYEEKTYADLMGPWDIPFHVELKRKGSPDSNDECSGITFAQHPSKTKETVLNRIRNCSTDDDDALPVIRPSRRRSNHTTPEATRPKRSEMDADHERKRSEIFRLQLPALDENREHHYREHHHHCEEQPDKQKAPPSPKPNENRVRKMTVFIERKYGQQKAVYNGMIDPRSGCPHGAGHLTFVTSGDVYIGEIAFGEMHGKGTYCHKKTKKLFRGNFVRNTYVGSGPPPSSHVLEI